MRVNKSDRLAILASKQVSKEARRQGGKQASKQASKQAAHAYAQTCNAGYQRIKIWLVFLLLLGINMARSASLRLHTAY